MRVWPERGPDRDALEQNRRLRTKAPNVASLSGTGFPAGGSAIVYRALRSVLRSLTVTPFPVAAGSGDATDEVLLMLLLLLLHLRSFVLTHADHFRSSIGRDPAARTLTGCGRLKFKISHHFPPYDWGVAPPGRMVYRNIVFPRSKIDQSPAVMIGVA